MNLEEYKKELENWKEEHTNFYNDRLTLEEMLTFVRNEKGRFEAQSGAHDDMVMAIAIAYQGLTQVIPKKNKPKRRDESENLINYWG